MLIIGGGIIGLTTALELKQRGFSVVVLERNQPGEGASGAAGGILSPLRPWQNSDRLTQLCTLSLSRYRTLLDQLQQHGICVEHAITGSLYLMPDEAPAAAGWARLHGWDFRALDTAALAREEPAVETGTGFLFPQVARIEPRTLLDALVSTTTRLGVKIHAHRAVRSIEISGHRAVGVRTDAGPIAAGRIVVCAGAWMTPLLPATPARPEIQPVRGQMIEYAAPPGLLRHIVLRKQEDSPMDCYLIPRPNGHILAGSTLERCGFSASVTDAARVALAGFAVRTLPALATCPITRQWAGLRPDASRATPIICAHPEIGNLFLNGGHFRNGILLAPASALLLAQLICKRTPAMDTAAFGINGTLYG